MELMGQWAPGAFESTMPPTRRASATWACSASRQSRVAQVHATDVVGGGNGFAIGKNASPEAVDFVKYLTRRGIPDAVAKENFCIPVVKGGEAGLNDPLLKMVQQGAAAAKYFQLYYDQYLPPAMGSVVNDSVQGLFAGTLDA